MQRETVIWTLPTLSIQRLQNAFIREGIKFDSTETLQAELRWNEHQPQKRTKETEAITLGEAIHSFDGI